MRAGAAQAGATQLHLNFTGAGIDLADIPFETIRTNRRKTIAIDVQPERVRILAPRRLSQGDVRELVAKHAAWIRARLESLARIPPKVYAHGEEFAYLGQSLRLELAPGGAGEEVALDGDRLLLSADPSLAGEDLAAHIKSRLERWYLERARQRLTAATHRYAEIVGARPRRIEVRNYKSRWGACSAQGDISYSWQIIMAPPDIIDYLVVHELCHLIEHNHSPRFWQEVARVLPDYKARRKWLADNTPALRL